MAQSMAQSIPYRSLTWHDPRPWKHLRGLDKLAALTVRHAVPAIYPYRPFPAAGGLMSYGTDLLDNYRLTAFMPGGFLRLKILRIASRAGDQV